MIKLNGSVVKIEHFADNTQKIKVQEAFGSEHKIDWKYEDDSELVTLIFLVKHMRNKDKNANIILNLWYIPNARQDRVKKPDEVFTLKYFAEIINDLSFKKVRVMDAHSSVSLCALDRVEDLTPEEYIKETINRIYGKSSGDYEPVENLVVYFPDDGAAKRYKDMPALATYEKIYGKKVRDWETREIIELKIVSDCNKCVQDIIKDKRILMTDDIISSGKTLLKGAKILKEDLQASEIYAFASHVENVDKEGHGEGIKEALDLGYIEKVYTTNSLYNGSHDKIKIVNS